MTKEMESIAQKVKKLFEKAEGAQKLSSQAEAELFLAKAEELMLKYNLSQVDLNGSTDKKLEVVEEHEVFIFGQKVKQEGTWDSQLASVLAHNNYCELIYYAQSNSLGTGNTFNKKASLIGDKANTEIVLYLYSVLLKLMPEIATSTYVKKVKELRSVFTVQAKSQEEASTLLNKFFDGDEWIENGFRVSKDDMMPLDYSENMKGKVQGYTIKNLKTVNLPERGTFIRSFLYGCVKGFETKLKSEKEQFLTNESVSNTAIVNISKAVTIQHNKAIDKFISRKYPNIRSTSNKGETAGNSDAFSLGVQAGKSVNVSVGINGINPEPKRLK